MKQIKGGDIKALREYCQLSAAQLAQAAEVTEEDYMNWESGAKTPTFSQLLSLLRVSGIDTRVYFKQVCILREHTLLDFLQSGES